MLGDTAAASLPRSPRPAGAGGAARQPVLKEGGAGAALPRSRVGPLGPPPHLTLFLSPAPQPRRHARPRRARRKPPP